MQVSCFAYICIFYYILYTYTYIAVYVQIDRAWNQKCSHFNMCFTKLSAYKGTFVCWFLSGCIISAYKGCENNAIIELLRCFHVHFKLCNLSTPDQCTLTSKVFRKDHIQMYLCTLLRLGPQKTQLYIVLFLQPVSLESKTSFEFWALRFGPYCRAPGD